MKLRASSYQLPRLIHFCRSFSETKVVSDAWKSVTFLAAGSRRLVADSWQPVAFLVCLTTAYATTVVPMSVERLTSVSSRVVVAHAIKSWSTWNAQHTMINTYTQFSVDTSLKGPSADVITVKQPGGSADGYTQHVSGVRPWSAGESAVLFLQPSASNDGTFVVTGLMQGNFRVRRTASGTAIADNGVPAPASQIGKEVSSFNPADKTLTPYSGNRMKLDDLVQRVRSAVRTR